MPEVRIDPLNGQRTIIAPAPEPSIAPGRRVGAPAPLATTDVLAAWPPDGEWLARALAVADPAVDRDAPDPEPSAEPDLFWAGAARGVQEVIVHSQRAVASLAELTDAEAGAALDMWRARMRLHGDAPCRHLSVEEQPGATQSRAELAALDFVPSLIARERERFGAYATRTMGGDLLADLVQQEVRRRDRIVAIDEEAVLISAYAARAPYQLLLAPRTPRMRFEDDGPTGALLLRDALRRLHAVLGAMPPLALWVRTAPQGAEHFCWRIDIVPAVGEATGLGTGAGVPVNPVSPELAAARLRDAGGG